jgi:hypothetical protein
METKATENNTNEQVDIKNQNAMPNLRVPIDTADRLTTVVEPFGSKADSPCPAVEQSTHY